MQLVCVVGLFVEVVMSDTGREEKKSGWFQDNFVKNYVKLHCSKKKPIMDGLPPE